MHKQTLFNKQKYIRLYQGEGSNAALTSLHHDKEYLEQLTFESKDGYSRELWDSLEEVRNFSIELWDLCQKTPPSQ
ncbi:MAG: hypothetical protein HY843_03520 [Bdellovibrio sp.]|nr:hypothetical protein [Bdellovibrio sp.]